MKLNLFCIAVAIIVGTANAAAQTALSFTEDRAVIASGGRHDIPQSVWNNNQTLYIDIVNSLEPELGFENWTGQNSWQPEPGSQWIGNVNAQREQYIKIDVPGLWTNMYSGVGEEKKLYIRRIADPTLTIGAISKPLSQWSFPQDVPRGTNVTLTFPQFFVSPGNNWIEKEGVEITPSRQQSYNLSSGIGNVTYTMNSRDGWSANATYSKQFSLNYEAATYTLTASAGAGGTISPSGAVIVNAGANQTFTASYDVGYERNTLIIDSGANVNSDTYTFTNIDANHTITLTSKATTYTITYNLNGGSGASNSAYTIESSEITLPTPTKEGHDFQGWYENANLTGNAVTSIPSGSTGHKVFYAKWQATAPTTYTLTATAGSGGAISPSGAVTVVQGESQTFTATPADGKMVDRWQIDGLTVATSGNTYTVTNVQADAAVQVLFKDVPPVQHTVSFDADGGSPTPEPQTVTNGEKATEPTAPTKDGFVFEGWYNGAAKWNFATDVVADNITLTAKWDTEPPLPIFDSLAGEYTQSADAVPLKLKGRGSAAYTIFKVNGETATLFVPSAKGVFKIEALTADGKSRIETYITVK